MRILTYLEKLLLEVVLGVFISLLFEVSDFGYWLNSFQVVLGFFFVCLRFFSSSSPATGKPVGIFYWHLPCAEFISLI